ncbi:alpha,alpha-trehalose-phosphate synthase [UDP-forming] 1-like protein [Tanacetum coccineum]
MMLRQDQLNSHKGVSGEICWSKGVDRLDMIKGVPQKLLAFEKFLEDNPNWRDKVVLLQIVVPTRIDVPEYQKITCQVHEIDRSRDFHALCALYPITDVALVTSLRDGMNLVSYEFVACQASKKGVLILRFNATVTEPVNASDRRIDQFKEMELNMYPELKEPLKKLSDDPKTTVVIMSGSHRCVLEEASSKGHVVAFVDWTHIECFSRSCPKWVISRGSSQWSHQERGPNLEQFKSETLASQEETRNLFNQMRESIDRNKVEADQQFAEIMNAFKALQPPTTLPAIIPRFEENSGQSFGSDEVEKEVKDIGFIGALVIGSEVADGYGGKKLPQTDSTLKDLDTEDIGTCIGVLESANCQDHRNPTWAGDESHIREKDVPSHGPRKEHMGELIFGARLELIVGVDLRAFEGLNSDLRSGEERITWNPGINHHPSERKGNPGLNSFIKSNMNSNHVFQHFRPNDDQHERRGVQRRVWDPGIMLKQHLEDKVFLEAGVLIRIYLIVSLLFLINIY